MALEKGVAGLPVSHFTRAGTLLQKVGVELPSELIVQLMAFVG
ncbi:hypothetical protein OK016_27275 [Vibrio chagasii]|nr:hypothetical protein [Vibrio chagasii]